MFLGWFTALAPLAARQKGVTWRDVRDAYVEADALLCGGATTASVPWLLHKDVGPAIRLRGTLLVREELVQGQGLAVIVSDVRGWCAPPLPSADLASPLISETVVPVDREVQFVDVNAAVDLLVTAHPFRSVLAPLPGGTPPHRSLGTDGRCGGVAGGAAPEQRWRSGG